MKKSRIVREASSSDDDGDVEDLHKGRRGGGGGADQGSDQGEEDAPAVRTYGTRKKERGRFSNLGVARKTGRQALSELLQEEDDEEDMTAWKEETTEERERRLNFVVDDDGTGYVEDDLEREGTEYQQQREGTHRGGGDDDDDDDAEGDDDDDDRKRRSTKSKAKKKIGVEARAAQQKNNLLDMFSKVERRRQAEREEEATHAAVTTTEVEADLDATMGDALFADLLASTTTATKKRPNPATKLRAQASPYGGSSSITIHNKNNNTRHNEEYAHEDNNYAPPDSYDEPMPYASPEEGHVVVDDGAKLPTEAVAAPPPPVETPAVPTQRSKLLALAASAPRAQLQEAPPKIPPAAAAVPPMATETSGSASAAAKKEELEAAMRAIQPAPPPLPTLFTENATMSLSANQVFPTTAEEGNTGKEFLEMYWMDMWEDRSCPGDVFVFGRVPAPQQQQAQDASSATETPTTYSGLVQLRNVPRMLLVLPRGSGAADEQGKKAVQDEVYDAIRARLDPAKRENCRLRSKWVRRNYAFELPGIPRGEADYLLVQYSMALESRGSIPAFPEGRTFAHVFGANQSAIERLVLLYKLMGPSWIRIKSSATGFAKEKTGKSHAKFEAVVDLDSASLELIQEKRPTPRVSVMSLSLKTVVDPVSHQHQIVAATGVLHPEVPLDATSCSKPPSTSDAFLAFQLVRPLGVGLDFPLGFSQLAAQNGVTCVLNERALLSLLLAKIHLLDPDVLLGHNIEGFELDLLLSRTKVLKIGYWSKLGRLNLQEHPRSKKVAGGRTSFVGVLTPGRLVLDTYRCAQEFVLNQREYSLNSLCDSMGVTSPNHRRVEIDPSSVGEYFKTRDTLLFLLRHTAETAQLALGLAFKLEAVSLSFELTTIAGNLWRRTLGAGRAERIEYLLLHAFHNLDFIVPDKEDYETSLKRRNGAVPGKRQKAAYSGGLVLEPKVGLYDTFIVLLDFNALYPSIIQEYNICFTTVERPATSVLDNDEDGTGNSKRGRGGARGEDDEDNNNNQHHHEDQQDAMDVAAGEGEDGVGEDEAGADADDQVPLPADDGRGPKGLAILPTVIKNIVDRRVQVKNQLAVEQDAMKRRQLDTRQKALKITANSMYGCLGFSASRFFARPLASLVTSRGRLILQDTVQTTAALGFEVVYGDTDSIMINTRLRWETRPNLTAKDLEPVHKIADTIRAGVNPKYKYLKIALDGVFSTLLLLKKKKYASLSVSVVERNGQQTVSMKRETKGLDLVRRDWCLASKDVGSAVLDLILSGKAKDDVVDGVLAVMNKFRDDARGGKVPVDRWAVTKGLNKSPRDYPDAKGQPHLQVALAMLERGKVVNTGDHIAYVICTKTRTEKKAHDAAATAEADKPGVGKDEILPAEVGLASATTTTTAMAVTSPPAKASTSFADRAFHPDEIKPGNSGLEVDLDWYLATQILPPVQRLCEVIEGITSSQLADALGLDPVKFKTHAALAPVSPTANFDEVFGTSFAADKERFKDCARIELECPTCSLVFQYPGIFWLPEQRKEALGAIGEEEAKAIAESVVLISGTRCPRGCNMDRGIVDATVLQNLLVLSARQSVRVYYQGWNVSDDPAASDLKTRQQSLRNVYSYQGRRVHLHRKYSSKELWIQLLYLVTLVDEARTGSSLNRENELRKKDGKTPFVLHSSVVHERQELMQVKAYLERAFLHSSAYSWIKADFFQKVFRVQ